MSQENAPQDDRTPQGRSQQGPSVNLSAEQRSKALGVLCSQLNSNAQLHLPALALAMEKGGLSNLSTRQKLVLAETLSLYSEQLSAPQSGLAVLEERRSALQTGLREGIGQLLEQLKPMEKAAHQIMLWKRNSVHGNKATLPGSEHTSVALVNPGMLDNPSFHKVFYKAIEQKNAHFARGEYKAFVFLPFEAFKGKIQSLKPFLQVANKFQFHIFGSLPIEDSQDATNKLFNPWRLTLNDAGETEREILSRASIVINHLVARRTYSEYHESEPLTVGLEYAFAGAATRFLKREKPGHWFVPVLHPSLSPKEMKTVNLVDKKDTWKKCIERQLNYAYSVSPLQEPTSPGVRILGATTTFPIEREELDDIENSKVPLFQVQARMTKNRIRYYLESELDRELGGQKDPKSLQRQVEHYLRSLKDSKQIAGFEVKECYRNDAGIFFVKVGINWIPTASEFIIDLDSSTLQPA